MDSEGLLSGIKTITRCNNISEMDNHSKRKNSIVTTIIIIIVLSILLIGVIAVLIIDLVTRFRNGWNNNDTIQIVFSLFIVVAGIGATFPIHEYCLKFGKKMEFLNNEIYRLFREVDQKHKLAQLKESYVLEQYDKSIDVMQRIFRKKDKNVIVNKNNLDSFFDNTSMKYKGSYNLSCFQIYRVNKEYKRIRESYSRDYESLFRDISSGDILKKPHLPVFELILPFFFGAFGLFATIYQTLNVNGELKEPLLNYLKLFGAVIFFVFSLELGNIRTTREQAIKSKTDIINRLKNILNND